MTQSQLIQYVSAPKRGVKPAKISHHLKQENFSLRELVDLTFFHDEEVALKAAKLLEYILLKFPENYYEDIIYLTERAKEVTSTNCKRSYARIIMHITSPEVPKEVRNYMKEIDLDQVVDLCFEWLNDPKMLITIRTAAGEALFNMRHSYPWIAEKLSNQLENIIKDTTPAMVAKADMILSYLHPED